MNNQKETPYGELYEITGLQSSPARIAPELHDTQLKGVKVLFGKHDPTGAGYPPAALLQSLLA
jgi:hypothetical protein